MRYRTLRLRPEVTRYDGPTMAGSYTRPVRAAATPHHSGTPV